MTIESDQLIESDLKTRVIFMLKSPLNNDFLINHTTPELLKDVYSRHYIGRKKKTAQLVENLKMENLRLCMFPLMEVECTTSEASKYAAICSSIYVIFFVKEFLEKLHFLLLLAWIFVLSTATIFPPISLRS